MKSFFHKKYIFYFLFLISIFSVLMGKDTYISLTDLSQIYSLHSEMEGDLLKITFSHQNTLWVSENSKTYKLNDSLGEFSRPVLKKRTVWFLPYPDILDLITSFSESKKYPVNHQATSYPQYHPTTQAFPPQYQFSERKFSSQKKNSELDTILEDKEKYLVPNFSHYKRIGFEFKTSFLRPDNYDIDEKHLQRHFVTGAGFKWGFGKNFLIEILYSHWYDTFRGYFFGKNIIGERNIDLNPCGINLYYFFQPHKRAQIYLGIGASKIYGKYHYFDQDTDFSVKNDTATVNMLAGVEYWVNKLFSLFVGLNYYSGDLSFNLEEVNSQENLSFDGIYIEIGGNLWLW